MNNSNNDSKIKILEMLREGGYVTGGRISKELNITRQAVWKHIEALKASGFEIESQRRVGYRLLNDSSELTFAGIESRVAKKNLNYKVMYFDEIDSTNLYAIRLASKGEVDLDDGKKVLVVSDTQTGGLGRRGRNFISPNKTSIYMSILLRPQIAPENVSAITLVSAMAVRKALYESISQVASGDLQEESQLSIKWPNDIYINDKKVCGILTQMSCEMDFISYVVVGIGINVNNKSFPEEISDRAVSLYQMFGEKFNREIIIGDILKCFDKYMDVFLSTGNMEGLKDEYNSYLLNMDREVTVYNGLVENARPDEIRQGIGRGIDDFGNLLVEINGEIVPVFSGEVSVR